MTTTGTYDSTIDTLIHIRRVQTLLAQFANELIYRAIEHDETKLSPPEKEVFDRETPLLKSLVFGSEDYKASLSRLGEALSHHYKENSHHPEHFADGVSGMTLMDVVEMLLDWKAASERQKEQVLNLTYCFERFKIDKQLAQIFINTAIEKGWAIR